MDRNLTPLINLRLTIDTNKNIQSEPKIQSIIENIENLAIKMIKLIDNTTMRDQLYKKFRVDSPALF